MDRSLNVASHNHFGKEDSARLAINACVFKTKTRDVSRRQDCDRRRVMKYHNHLKQGPNKTFLSFFWGGGWIGSRVVSVLDSGAVGPGFKSQS